jgi:hypothetical protein
MSELIPNLDDLKSQVLESRDCTEFLSRLDTAGSEAAVRAAVDNLVQEWLAAGDPADD